MFTHNDRRFVKSLRSGIVPSKELWSSHLNTQHPHYMMNIRYSKLVVLSRFNSHINTLARVLWICNWGFSHIKLHYSKTTSLVPQWSFPCVYFHLDGWDWDWNWLKLDPTSHRENPKYIYIPTWEQKHEEK